MTGTVLLLGFAISSQSVWQPLDEIWRDWLGFAPTNLLDFQWHRLLTSLPLTAGGWKFAASLGMLAVCVGLAEGCYGTLQTIKLFFTTHVLVLVIMSIVLITLSACLSSPSLLSLTSERDIGPSAGYYGCLGALLLSLPASRQHFWFLCVFSVLLLRLAISTTNLPAGATVVSADIAHLMALPIGAFLTWCEYVTPASSAPLGPSQNAPLDTTPKPFTASAPKPATTDEFTAKVAPPADSLTAAETADDSFPT